ncbi:MAG TPA: shikimate dehydrogenase [Gaiellales bacterium]|nr:shikimate dehydrogenase [Gaiellales bacterium]
MAADPGRRRAAVIGHPVAHSRSPAMHTAAYEALGLDREYVAIDVEPAVLDLFVGTLAADGFAGVNVTIPHKQAVIELCDELSDEARRAGSVNTVLVRDGGLRGETTDGAGLLWALGEVEPADALVLGAGGAARAAVTALADAGWDVAVSARRREGAAALGVGVEPWPPQRGARLVVNATPLGQQASGPGPVPDELITPETIVCDLAYRGDLTPTPLMQAAAARGARAVDGLDVLVGQGIVAFELLTGVPAPVDVMRAAAWGRTPPDR